jgi:hypothetical protein
VLEVHKDLLVSKVPKGTHLLVGRETKDCHFQVPQDFLDLQVHPLKDLLVQQVELVPQVVQVPRVTKVHKVELVTKALRVHQMKDLRRIYKSYRTP